MIKEFIQGFKNGYNEAKEFRDFLPEKEFIEYCISNNLMDYCYDDNLYELTDKGACFKNYCGLILENKLEDKACNIYYEDIIDNAPLDKIFKKGRKQFLEIFDIDEKIIDEQMEKMKYKAKVFFFYDAFNRFKIMEE